MLDVYYDKIIGEVTVKDSMGVYRKCPICQCNALYAIMCFYNNGEDCTQLMAFAIDEQHLKNMLGMNKKFAKIESFYNGDYKGWVLNQNDQNALKIMAIFNKAKIPYKATNVGVKQKNYWKKYCIKLEAK